MSSKERPISQMACRDANIKKYGSNTLKRTLLISLQKMSYKRLITLPNRTKRALFDYENMSSIYNSALSSYTLIIFTESKFFREMCHMNYGDVRTNNCVKGVKQF